MSDLADIAALGPDGVYRTHRQETIYDTGGTAVAEMSLVPRIFVTRAVMAQRRARPLPLPHRQQSLLHAASIFATERLGGLDFEDYLDLTCRISGLPRSVATTGAQAAADGMRTAFDAVLPAQPRGATLNWAEQSAGALWARRGEVLAVHAPGNAPGVHGLWPQALALGLRVAVRPSRREPLTAHRMILALRKAGFRDSDAVFLPTDYAGADHLIAAGDLALVYGGQDVVDRYTGNPNVLTNGPGRTKILITAEQDWRPHLDTIVDSIGGLAGMACVNTTAVLYEGDPAELAQAIAERLAAIPVAELPSSPWTAADQLVRHLRDKAVGTTALLGADQVLLDRGDGYAVLRPALHLLRGPDPAILNVEMPFPCAWVAEWRRADGLAPLRNSLVLNVITEDHALIDDIVTEPTIINVYLGRHTTYRSDPQVPHEGFLADFLMRNMGFIRS
jgi:acyl-CoA reductase-like NAD-dependent aldehyde dehydrogenase